MKITQDLISTDRYWLKAPYAMTPYGICIHNTDNDAPAKNEIAYMKRNDNSTSFHIAVDDKEAIQAIPVTRNAWHAGDGGNGTGNRKYIAIEICYSLSGGSRFIQAEKNAAKVTANILMDRGWGVDRVKRHYDFSGKNCPRRTMAMGWERFLNMVTENMKGVPKMEEKAIVLNGYADFPAAEPLAAKLGAGIFLRATAESRQVAKQIYIIGGGRAGLKGSSFVDLSGSNRWDTAKKVGEYFAKL